MGLLSYGLMARLGHADLGRMILVRYVAASLTRVSNLT